MIDCCGSQNYCEDFPDHIVRDALSQSREAACLYGTRFRFYVREESEIQRDPYTSIISRDAPGVDVAIPGLPVNYTPSRWQLEKSGIKEPVDLIITTATAFWYSLNIEFRDVDIVRWRVENISGIVGIPSHAFRIKEIQPKTIIKGVPIYWVFGLVED